MADPMKGLAIASATLGLMLGLVVGGIVASDRARYQAELRFAKWCSAPGFYTFTIDSSRYKINCEKPFVYQLEPWDN